MKVFRQYGRFQTGMKISRSSGRFLDSLGSMPPKRNTTQTAFTGEMRIHWNGPVVSRANHILFAFLDSWFGSRGRWHFQTGTNKFYTYEILDGKKSEVSRLSFVNETSSCEIYCTIYCLTHLNHTCKSLGQKDHLITFSKMEQKQT